MGHVPATRHFSANSSLYSESGIRGYLEHGPWPGLGWEAFACTQHLAPTLPLPLSHCSLRGFYKHSGSTGFFGGVSPRAQSLL